MGRNGLQQPLAANAPPAGALAPPLIPTINGGSKNGEYVHLLHLTDPHFTQSFTYDTRPEFLKRLERELQGEWRPGKFDLILVTGDVADNAALFWRTGNLQRVFESAKDYFERLCRQEEIEPAERLFVIAGNHDARWKGLIRSAKSTRLFRGVFEPYTRHRYFPEMKLLVSCFDSNYVRNAYEAARGIVPASEFDPVIREARGLPGIEEAVRVALVHHHPLPVASAEDLAPTKWWERAAEET